MISFRFHVVSITAVFLAIAIGVVVGSTYVDGAVVDGLRNRIATVSHNLDDRKAENDRLEDDLDTARDYIDLSADFAVSDRLTDVPVLLLAVRGVDEGTVEQLATLARRAGAVTPGIVWLEPKWALDDETDRAELSALLGRQEGEPVAQLRAGAWRAIAAELVAPPVSEREPTDETTAAIGAAPDEVLTALEARGFLTVDSLDDAVGLAHRPGGIGATHPGRHGARGAR